MQFKDNPNLKKKKNLKNIKKKSCEIQMGKNLSWLAVSQI